MTTRKRPPGPSKGPRRPLDQAPGRKDGRDQARGAGRAPERAPVAERPAARGPERAADRVADRPADRPAARPAAREDRPNSRPPKRLADAGPASGRADRPGARPAAPGKARSPASRPGPRATTTPPEPARGRVRDTADALWLFGTHAVLAALANPNRRCRQLLLTEGAAETLAPRLDALLARAAVAAEQVEREVIDRLLPPGSVHQGVALRCQPLEEPDLAEACTPAEGESGVVVVLDQVTDPHNVGAVLRSAAAFGARAVIVTERHAPAATGTLAKAASGALDIVPLIRATNLARALDDLARLGYWRVGLDGKAGQTLSQVDTSGNVVLVLGAEGAGLRRLTAERCDHVARLPIRAEMESLNVSNAAAVALYEIARGRGD
ncbi:23S rRNA (guanosine(2251)-2'-O)-methyltransferase RlmB [Zavarzinia sp. CC-PAN008]|uniref:23S rRNA (guanosine(2251)-2'-O)-methyltransferase RlmB n=1 Tax=Zavarzinia sp. CC-PAN008 TaxID=3243332 RepID=UPI003F749036